MADEPDNGDEARDAGAANDDNAEDEASKPYDWSAFYDDEGRLYDYNRYARSGCTKGRKPQRFFVHRRDPSLCRNETPPLALTSSPNRLCSSVA
jgi:hypothetical protein